MGCLDALTKKKKGGAVDTAALFLENMKKGKSMEQKMCIDYLWSPDEDADEKKKKGCLKKLG